MKNLAISSVFPTTGSLKVLRPVKGNLLAAYDSQCKNTGTQCAHVSQLKSVTSHKSLHI